MLRANHKQLTTAVARHQFAMAHYRLTTAVLAYRLVTARRAGCLMGCLMGCLIYRRPYLYSSALYAIGDPCPRSVCALHIPLKETPQSGKRLQAARGVSFVKQGEIVALSPCNPHYFSGIFFVSVENSAANNCFCRVFCSKIRLFQAVTRSKVALCRRKVALLK